MVDQGPMLGRFLADVAGHPVVAYWPLRRWKVLFRALGELGWRLVKDEQ